MASIDLGALAGFAEGALVRVTVSNRSLLVVRRGEVVYALRDLCPHQGARLSDGHLTAHVPACLPGTDIQIDRSGEIVVCPWHGWEFDVQTGRSLCDPQKTRVRSYITHVEHGRVFVEVD